MTGICEKFSFKIMNIQPHDGSVWKVIARNPSLRSFKHHKIYLLVCQFTAKAPIPPYVNTYQLVHYLYSVRVCPKSDCLTSARGSFTMYDQCGLTCNPTDSCHQLSTVNNLSDSTGLLPTLKIEHSLIMRSYRRLVQINLTESFNYCMYAVSGTFYTTEILADGPFSAHCSFRL